jgi:hypothetical protein
VKITDLIGLAALAGLAVIAYRYWTVLHLVRLRGSNGHHRHA